MSGKGLDMVRVQNDSMAIPVAGSAFLAGVIVAFVHRFAPLNVFALAACYIVLVTLVDVTSPLGSLCSFGLFMRGGVGDLGATKRAYLAQPTAFAIFGHRLAADGAWGCNAHAFGAHLVRATKIVRAFAADLAGDTDTARVCLEARSAGHAGSILDWLAIDIERCHWLAALSTGRKSGVVARFAEPILSAICFAFDASVLCHTAIIPQLPDLEKTA